MAVHLRPLWIDDRHGNWYAVIGSEMACHSGRQGRTGGAAALLPFLFFIIPIGNICVLQSSEYFRRIAILFFTNNRKAGNPVNNPKEQLLAIIEKLSENEVIFLLEFLRKILHLD